MHIVYTLEYPPETFDKAIFLAGPTPRSEKVRSWRPEALRILELLKYDGVVFVPEPRGGQFERDYDANTDWEERSLHLSDCIVFWVPRNLKTMPAFTTNDEWGHWKNSGKVVFGAPSEAQKIRYQRYYANKFFVPHHESLEETLRAALDFIGSGSLRSRGEREVPLYIWETTHFQQWYGALKRAGNRLDHARVEWTFRVGPQQKIIFISILHADIFVGSEGRNKVNEVVISRPDIAAVMLYRRDQVLDNSDIVLVREFRSSVATEDGFVWELPSGSSRTPTNDFRSVAVHECQEEVGFSIDAHRMKQHEVRQLAATFSTHKAHLFSAEITEEELERFRSLKGIAHGVVGDSERTYVEIVKLRDIRKKQDVDWSMLGMILSVFA